MCNITLIDTMDGIITARDVRELTMINSLLGNVDGFGYTLFSDHKVIKTKEEATIYWRDNYNNFIENESYNGIYHVRKSSVTTYSGYVQVIDKTTVSDEKSHPFDYNDIIVAHNGFLTYRHQHLLAAKYEKDIMGDLIDSQKFAVVLSKHCEQGKVTFDNIKESLNLFSGAYCLAIKGKKDNNVWLCRGKDRTLFSMQILNNGIPVGNIVNTTTMGLYMLGEWLVDFDYDYNVKELKENTIYTYNLNSYEVIDAGSVVQDSPYDTIKVDVPTNSFKWDNKHTVNVNETIYEDIFDLMYEMGLLITDMIVLTELIFNKSILSFDDNDFLEFKVFLKRLDLEAHNSRQVLWGDLQKYKEGSIFNLYKDLHYPYMLNSKDDLKHCLHNLEDKSRKEKNNELLTLQ